MAKSETSTAAKPVTSAASFGSATAKFGTPAAKFGPAASFGSAAAILGRRRQLNLGLWVKHGLICDLGHHA